MKRILLTLVVLFLILAALMVTRAALLKPAVLSSVSPATPIAVDEAAALQRFAAAIRIPTESRANATIDTAAIARFRDSLAASFPRVHAALAPEVLPSGSILYTWRGQNSALDPVILMAHMDVVPADPATLSHWQHAPYSADIADGAIWGRGTLDDKVSVVALLEAAETLLAQGFTPIRTVLFAFGDDEESGGPQGAPGIVQLLKSRGIHAQFVVDEGGLVIRGAVSGLAQPVAVIGISEKGFLDLALSTTGTGGHSSEPPPHTAVGQLAAGLARLEDHSFPGSLPAPVELQLTSVAPYMPFSKRLILANLWLTRPLIVSTGLKDAKQAGGYHTTTAETIFNGGIKDNVLPTEANATVNFRILPGETTDSVLAAVRARVADSGITVAKAGPFRDPSPVSPTDSDGYRTLSSTIRSMFPSAIVSPYLVQAATDSSYYYALSPNVYRFAPIDGDISMLSMVHGFNERISIANYIHAIQFEAQLLKNIH